MKLPLAYSLGRKTWKVEGDAGGEDGGLLFKELVSRLAGRVSERSSEDEDVKRAGVIIDTAAAAGEDGVEMLAHVIDEFSGTFTPCLNIRLRFRTNVLLCSKYRDRPWLSSSVINTHKPLCRRDVLIRGASSGHPTGRSLQRK